MFGVKLTSFDHNSNRIINFLKLNQMATKSKYEQHGTAVQNEVVIHRVFDLPLSKVWRALTEPEQFKKW